MKKSEYILSINPCIYGMNYHDPGAAIILDGEILFAIEEERLNGIKGSKGIFPELSIKACLDYCGIDKNQISCITIGYNPELWMKRLQLELVDIIDKCQENQEVESRKVMNRIIDSNLVDRYKFYSDYENVKNLIMKKTGIEGSEIRFFDHHMSHIASSYECSQFDDAVGIVVDGIGECECTTRDVDVYSNYEYVNELNLDYDFFFSKQFIKTLSGGEKVKIQLLKLLCENPDALFLDEPSNDLDIDTLTFLETFITNCSVPIVFISHDETLIENSANTIIHIEQLVRKTKCKITVSGLDYQEYLESRNMLFDKQTQVALKERSEYKKKQDRLRQLYEKARHNSSWKSPDGIASSDGHM